jgi:Fe-S-cluster-containing hydrogenase component 2
MRGGKAYINNGLCTRCGDCFSACPVNAIRPNTENPSLRSGRGGGMGLRRGGGKGMGRQGGR